MKHHLAASQPIQKYQKYFKNVQYISNTIHMLRMLRFHSTHSSNIQQKCQNKAIHSFADTFICLVFQIKVIDSIAMANQPQFTSVAFNIEDYKITCEIEDSRLKITVLSLSQTKTTLSLAQFISHDQTLSLWISKKIQQNQRALNQINEGTVSSSNKNVLLMKKIDQLEKNYRGLESKVQGYTNQRKELLKKKVETKNQFVPNLCLSPTQTYNKYKSQLSSNKLGEIISEKEQEIYILQRKVNERDQLVRELAEGLMAANSQKEDIFNQYEKMLQTVVFQKTEEATLLPAIVKEQMAHTKKEGEQRKKSEKISQQPQVEEYTERIQINKEE